MEKLSQLSSKVNAEVHLKGRGCETTSEKIFEQPGKQAPHAGRPGMPSSQEIFPLPWLAGIQRLWLCCGSNKAHTFKFKHQVQTSRVDTELQSAVFQSRADFLPLT